MVRSLLTFKVADLFCGAGGFSEAVVQALGDRAEIVAALNHWPPAIETHNANHPGGKEADLYDADPLKFVPEGKLDLLVASPTCTFHSRARGGRPISWDQRKGRMTPTQVTRWCKALRPTRLIVENVPEFLDWGPISRKDGKPRKDKKGLTFRGWIRDLEDLGYKVEWRILNAADFGGATTRRRFFLMARNDGKAIVWPKPTHSQTGPFGTRFKKWRAAREVINWKRRGSSIFTRKKPLAAKTLLRIYAGVVRFGWPLVFRVKLALYMRSLGIEVPDVGQAQQEMFDPAVLVEPFTVANRTGNAPRGIDEPIAPPVTSGGIGLAEPFMLSQGAGGAPRAASEPVPTIPTKGAHAIVAPYYGSSEAKTVEEPLGTVTTRDRFALVTPVTHADASMRARSTEDPLPTVTAAARGELAFILAAFGERKGQAARVHSVDDPAPTLCAQGRIPLVHGLTLEDLEGVDILFRMLEPDELARAMGFPRRYRFTGNKTQRTRMVGNAVEVKTARALVEALMADAA